MRWTDGWIVLQHFQNANRRKCVHTITLYRPYLSINNCQITIVPFIIEKLTCKALACAELFKYYTVLCTGNLHNQLISTHSLHQFVPIALYWVKVLHLVYTKTNQ